LGEYLLLQNKCLVQIKGNNKKQEVAEQVRREEANESIDNMHYINTTEVAQSVLTLTEALQTFSCLEESAMFKLKLQPKLREDSLAQSAHKMRLHTDEDMDSDRIIRIRKHEIYVDGQKQVIVMIRDFSDSIQVEKILLKQ
jgi:hypothetical protein